jgi:hypothetical protein
MKRRLSIHNRFAPENDTCAGQTCCVTAKNLYTQQSTTQPAPANPWRNILFYGSVATNFTPAML